MRAWPTAFRDDHQVDGAGRTVGEGDRDAVRAVVEGDDLVAEDVLGVVTRAVDDDAGQLAAQDLELGGGAAGVGPAGREARDGSSVGVDELGAGDARSGDQDGGSARGCFGVVGGTVPIISGVREARGPISR
jgi:hypothetical protein